MKQGRANVILWDDIKHNPPKQLNILPIAMIPHKSRFFQENLDLSFALRLASGDTVPSVSNSSVKTALGRAINQIGYSLTRLIHAFAQADKDSKVFMDKWDIKDGCWAVRLSGGGGMEFF